MPKLTTYTSSTGLGSAEFWHEEEGAFLAGPGIPEPPEDMMLEALPTGAVAFGSSGSSGVEKWVVHTRASLLASARAVNAQLKVGLDDVMGALLPFFHVGGLGVIARAYVAGVPCVEMNMRWSPEEATRFLAEREVTITSLVPTQVYDLVQARAVCPPQVRAVVVGGGSLSVELGRQARELGWPVLQSYGMSEAGSQIATASLESLAQPYTNIDLDVLPLWQTRVDDEGRLWISGDALCDGILTREAYERCEELRSNDRVRLGAGRLTFLGRADRIVKVKGELVDLDAYEAELSAQLGCQVVLLAEPHARDSHQLIVCASQPIQQVSHILPPYVEVARIHHVEEIPRSALGKVDRRALRRLL